MILFPSYTFKDVMNEYYIVYLALLNNGLMVRNEDYMMQSQISMLPVIDDKDRKQFFKHLEWATKDPSDILRSEDKGSSPEELKKFFGKT